MEVSSITAVLPGAIGVTHLKVYDTPTPDGLVGGSPHVHFACTEAYAVIAGQGAVQTLSAAGFEETPLSPGNLVWFTPGVIHRLINHDGQLEILVLMQNAGLPEAGDMALTFPAAILEDEQAYWSTASLVSSGQVFATGAEAARRRRDLAVEGFQVLCREFETQGVAALESFYSTALKLVQSRTGTWRERWERGPLAAAHQTGEQLKDLQQGRFDHLFEGRVYALPTPGGERKLGVCGTLGLYLPEGFA
ncbi:MAG TPA: cupin domain-containing protein [Herpetosiphonaceae bacterium]|nr:cupin domain-containing protein [Herpetosiphonaceae bacterium]